MDKGITPSMLQRITVEYYATPEKHYSIEVSLDGTILFRTPEKEGQWDIERWKAERLIQNRGSSFLHAYRDTDSASKSDSYRWRMCFYTQEGLVETVQGYSAGDENGFCDFEKFLAEMEDLTGENFGAFPQEKAERQKEGEQKFAAIQEKTKQGKYSQTVDAIIAFSQKLINRAAEKAGPGENCLISPLSVEAAFCLLAYASKGKSREELLSWMNVDFRKVQYICRAIINTVSDDTVFMATAFFADVASKPYVLSSFVEKIRSIASTELLTGRKETDAARMINDWAAGKTHGMIREVFSPGEYVDDLVLLNAVSFNAFWEDLFRSGCEGTFYAADGSRQKASYLCGREYGLIYDESVIGFMKPYDECGFQYVALLPRQTDNPTEWLRSLPDGKLGEYIRSAVEMSVTVKMPEFSFDNTLDLKTMLEEDGVKSVFDEETADISGMISLPQSYISGITHKTHIKLDYKGTSASALTEVSGRSGCSPWKPYFEVKFDRPFVFGIVHEKTGLPLFLGIVNTIEK